MTRLKSFYFFVILYFFTFSTVNGENDRAAQFSEAEKKIAELARQLAAVRFNDSMLFRINSQLVNEFKSTLTREGAFDYGFDSIVNVGKVASDNGLLRIFTWNLVKADGKHQQFGFIQYYLKEEKIVLLHQLNDKSDSIDNPGTKTLSAENWYGAIYYQILEIADSRGIGYTLIGWDGNDLYTSKKVIDVLYFDEKGIPKFGAPIFQVEKKQTNRVIFEYSRMVSMLVRWDSDYKMIVMDHLAPNNSIYEGNYKYYGPDLSYDGLKYINDLWEYVPAIDYKKPNKKQHFRQKR